MSSKGNKRKSGAAAAASSSSSSTTKRKARLPAKFRAKKPSDMPHRPLNSYNVFFSRERKKICEERDAREAEIKARGEVLPPRKKDFFQELAKTVASRWKVRIVQWLPVARVLHAITSFQYLTQLMILCSSILSRIFV